jgi:membrane protein
VTAPPTLPSSPLPSPGPAPEHGLPAESAQPAPGERPTGQRPWEGVSQRQTQLRRAATEAEAARPPVRGPLRWMGRTVADVVRKADRDRLLGLSAETAFFAVLTLFPGLLAATAVLGQLGTLLGRGTATRVEQAVLDFLDRLLTQSAQGVLDTVSGLFDSSGNALTLATLLALVSVSTAFATVVNTVTIAYDVPETRGWWRRRWLGLLLGTGTVITGALAVTLVVVGPLFGRGLQIVTAIGLGQEYAVVWDGARYPVAFLLLVLWATTMYHLAPPVRAHWTGDLPGALLAALLWLGASVGLNVYLKVVVVRSPILGALGGGLILMTWFYLLCASLLIGAELNTILRTRRRHRRAHRAQADAVQQDDQGQAARAQDVDEQAAAPAAGTREGDGVAARTAVLRPQADPR